MALSIILTIVLVLVAVILVVWGFKTYNKLVALRNTVDESFAQIATQLQRRFDLIPNLVSTVKAYASHEQSTLEAMTKARATAGRAVETGNASDVAAAEQAFGQARMAINAVAEAYPDLKASQNFLNLQEQLETTENKVAFARQNFNDSVLEYNNKVQSVPSNIVAKIGKFEEREMFAVESEEVNKAPKVEF